MVDDGSQLGRVSDHLLSWGGATPSNVGKAVWSTQPGKSASLIQFVGTSVFLYEMYRAQSPG